MPSAGPESGPPGAGPGAGPIRVLHVDDDLDLADLAAATLERDHDHIEVTTAASARDGLDVLAERSDAVDCVVSDYDMREMDGLDFLDAVRADYPDLPFILFTGTGSEEIASEAISAGVTDYLQKGGTEVYPVLANRIENAVEQYRARREADRTRRWYRSLFDHSHDIILVLDEDGTVKYYSPALERVLGYGGGNSPSTNVYDYVHPEDRERVLDHFGALLRAPDQTVTDIEFRVEHADGSWRWLEAAGSNETDTILDGYLVTLRDVTERKERERELERYRTIVETAGDAVYVLDSDGRFTEVNEQLLDRIGYDRDDLVGEAVAAVLDEESVERGQEAIQELLSSDDQSVAQFEVTVETADGDTYPSEVRSAPLTDGDGTFRGTVGVSRDVTDRKAREQELERYERIMETIGDAVYALDAEGHMIEVNEWMVELTGYDREELLDEHVSLYLEEDDLAEGREVIRELLRNDDKRVGTFEETIHRKDGDTVLVEVRLTLRPFEDGEFRGTVGTVREITERKPREEALRETNRQLQAVLDTVSAAIFIKDTDGRYLLMNEEGRDWVGIGEDEEITAYADSDVFSGELLEEVRAEDERVLEVGETVQSEAELQVGGETRTVLAQKNPLYDEDREPYAVCAVATDITEQKERERELERQNERLEEFASVVSHDLRNPLNTAVGRLELARQDCESEHLPPVARSLARMETLVEDILTLAREGQAATDLAPVDLGDVAAHCWRDVDAMAATLVTETDRVVMADESKLRRLLANLFRNSVEHGSTSHRSQAHEDAVEHGSTSPRSSSTREDAVEHGSTSPRSQAHEDAVEHGSTSSRAAPDDAPEPGDRSVTVTVGDLSDGSGFYVADDGPGIPEAERERVVDTGYSTSENGTGFGLSIVTEVAEAHGWELTLTESDDGGARFEIRGVETVADDDVSPA